MHMQWSPTGLGQAEERPELGARLAAGYRKRLSSNPWQTNDSCHLPHTGAHPQACRQGPLRSIRISHTGNGSKVRRWRLLEKLRTCFLIWRTACKVGDGKYCKSYHCLGNTCSSQTEIVEDDADLFNTRATTYKLGDGLWRMPKL